MYVILSLVRVLAEHGEVPICGFIPLVESSRKRKDNKVPLRAVFYAKWAHIRIKC